MRTLPLAFLATLLFVAPVKSQFTWETLELDCDAISVEVINGSPVLVAVSLGGGVRITCRAPFPWENFRRIRASAYDAVLWDPRPCAESREWEWFVYITGGSYTSPVTGNGPLFNVDPPSQAYAESPEYRHGGIDEVTATGYAGSPCGYHAPLGTMVFIDLRFVL